MEQQLLKERPRIEVVDALRGFAVMAIILLHNIEHFNLYSFPEPASDFMAALDQGIWATLFFLFSGKAYAIFALLFGFSFFIQDENQLRKGKDFRLRFAWRLVLLFLIGNVNAAFFPGEILVLYSILGFVLIPCCRLSNRWVLALAVLLMLQPMEWGKCFYALAHPEYEAAAASWRLHARDLYPALMADEFWQMIRTNLWHGQLFSLLWAWDYGRFFQTSSLFLLGMWLGRQGLFTHLEQHRRFWIGVGLTGALCFVPLYFLVDALPGWIVRSEVLSPLSTIVSSLRNFAFMSVWVSLFLSLWQAEAPRRWLKQLVPYGKMSLTNYLTQSLVGSFLYFGYGLALYDDLGTTSSFTVGVGLFLLQLGFCHWWLRHHQHGPFEAIWRKATWIGAK